MLTLNVRIPIFGEDNIISGDLRRLENGGLVYYDDTKTNISSSFDNILNASSKGKNVFMFGASKFSDNAVFSDKVDFFIGKNIPTKTNYFSIFISVSADHQINTLNIIFGTEQNVYPNSIVVNGKTYTDNDSRYFIKDIPVRGSGTIAEITIDNWSSDRYPLIIQGIYIGLAININNSNMKEITFEHMVKSSVGEPSYGIVSNKGNIIFNDLDGEIGDYAEQYIFNSDISAFIYLENHSVGMKKDLVGVYKTKEWNYNVNDASCQISLQDDLEEWQDILLDKIEWYEPKTMQQIYEYLYSKTPAKFNMYKFSELDADTKDILTKTTTKNPFFDSGSLWECWNKLCGACGLYIYKTFNDRTICKKTFY